MQKSKSKKMRIWNAGKKAREISKPWKIAHKAVVLIFLSLQDNIFCNAKVYLLYCNALKVKKLLAANLLRLIPVKCKKIVSI